MKKRARRFVCILLTLVFLLALSPAALALEPPTPAATLEELVTALAQDGVSRIALTAPITIASGENVTLDLNGKTVVYGAVAPEGAVTASVSDVMITNAGTLTITDSSSPSTGEICLSSGAFGSKYNLCYTMTTISNSGTLNISGGSIQADVFSETPKYTTAYAINNSGTLNLTGGSVTAAGFGATSCYYSGIYNTGDADLSGGSVDVKMTGGGTSGYYYGVYNSGAGDVTISGAEITAEKAADIKGTGIYGVYANDCDGGSITMTGGSVTVLNSNTLNAGLGYGISVDSDSRCPLDISGGTVKVSGNSTVYGIMGASRSDVISGGTVAVKTYSTAAYSASCAVYTSGDDYGSVTGGVFSAETDAEAPTSLYAANKMVISGGKFNTDPSNFVKQGICQITAGTDTASPFGVSVTYAFEVSENPNPDYTVKNTTKNLSYASLQDAVDAAAAGDTLKLLDSIDLGKTTVYISAPLTLDLDGKALSGNGTNAGVLHITGGTHAQPVVVTDSAATSFENAGSIAGGTCLVIGGGYTQVSGIRLTADYTGITQVFNVEGTQAAPAYLTIDGVKAAAASTTISNYNLRLMRTGSYSNVTINGGSDDMLTECTIESEKCSLFGIFYTDGGQSSSITINGGSYTVANTKALSASRAYVINANNGQNKTVVAIKGGFFKLSAAGSTHAQPIIFSIMTLANATVSGGWWSFQLTGNLAPNGYASVADSTYDGYGYKVIQTPAATTGAEASLAEYYSLQSAVDAVEADPTLGAITLVRSVVEDTVALSENVTIDKGSYTITLNGSPAVTAASEVTVPACLLELCQAKITNEDGSAKYYTILDNAIRASDGATVELLRSVTIERPITTAVCLDLAGFDLTCTDTDGFAFDYTGNMAVFNGMPLYYITLLNTGIGESTVNGGISLNARGERYSLSVGANVKVSAALPLRLLGNDTEDSVEAVIYGSLVSSGSYAVAGNGGSGYGGTTLSINDSSLVSAPSGTAIYQPQSGVTDVYGGSITGMTGIYIKSGTLNIYGGSIEATGDQADATFNGSGINPTGDALTIDSCGYPGGAPSVRITGGSFTSANARSLQEARTSGAASANQLLVAGGAFDGPVAANTITGFISGGIFAQSPSEAYLSSTSETIANPDGDTLAEYPYAVVKTLRTARIGGVYYSTLSAAIRAASSGGTIELLANTSETISAAKALTINLNGHTAANVTAGEGFVLTSDAGALTIALKPEIETVITESTKIEISETIPQAEAAAIAGVINEAQVSGVAEAIKPASAESIIDDTLGGLSIQADSVITVEISVTVAALEADLSGAAPTITFSATPTAAVLVDGVIYSEGAPVSNSALNGKPIQLRLPLPAGFEPVEIIHVKSDGARERLLEKTAFPNAAHTFEIVAENDQTFAVFTVTGFSEFIANGQETVAASIGTADYGTLQEAINAAVTGNIITLKKDCSESVSVSGKSLTIARNGFDYDADKIALGTSTTLSDSAASIIITYAPSMGGGSAGAYTITVKAENGSVKAPASADKGSTVSFTVTPGTGYKFLSVTVTGADGAVVETAAAADGGYSFKMPASSVTITAVFETLPWENPFSDVDEDDWFYGSVRYVNQNGLMSGTGEDVFEPAAPTTRAMVVTILWRLENEPAPAGENPFTDVEDGQWYTQAVLWASGVKLVEGYGGGLFGPLDPITREQLASILYRYAIYKNYDVSVGLDTNILSYSDAFDISEYAIPAIQWACGAGLMQGDNGALRHGDGAQRCELAAMLQRFCEKAAK